MPSRKRSGCPSDYLVPLLTTRVCSDWHSRRLPAAARTLACTHSCDLMSDRLGHLRVIRSRRRLQVRQSTECGMCRTDGGSREQGVPLTFPSDSMLHTRCRGSARMPGRHGTTHSTSPHLLSSLCGLLARVHLQLQLADVDSAWFRCAALRRIRRQSVHLSSVPDAVQPHRIHLGMHGARREGLSCGFFPRPRCSGRDRSMVQSRSRDRF